MLNVLGGFKSDNEVGAVTQSEFRHCGIEKTSKTEIAERIRYSAFGKPKPFSRASPAPVYSDAVTEVWKG